MATTSDERIEIASSLRHTRGIREFVDALGINLNGDWYWTDVSRRVADLIDPPEITEDTSDGYHTFGQLYYQRMMLFAVLVQEHKDCAWKTWNHEDGEPCFGGGWFLVTIDTPSGAYGYHYEGKYWHFFDCEELPKAKPWDGYDERDVGRLLSLVGKADLIDPTCKRVSMDAAGNPPFYTGGLALNDVTGGCSECGYPFGNSCRNIGNPRGVPNYCPNCGRRVVNDR